MPDEGNCCNCGGEHVPEFLVCLVRVKETEVARVSYLEAVRKLEGTSGGKEVMVVEPQRPVNVSHQLRDSEMLHVKTVDFFIIYCNGQTVQHNSRIILRKLESL
jgi:hypothetical protein